MDRSQLLQGNQNDREDIVSDFLTGKNIEPDIIATVIELEARKIREANEFIPITGSARLALAPLGFVHVSHGYFMPGSNNTHFIFSNREKYNDQARCVEFSEDQSNFRTTSWLVGDNPPYHKFYLGKFNDRAGRYMGTCVDVPTPRALITPHTKEDFIDYIRAISKERFGEFDFLRE